MDAPYEPGWRPWPVSWSGIWIGALSALAVGLIIGLIGYAIGAHQFTAPRTTTWRNVRVLTTIFNIGGAFFAFVVGGWIAARITGLGATLGGWMASGEPMTLGHYRRRTAEEYERPRRAA